MSNNIEANRDRIEIQTYSRCESDSDSDSREKQLNALTSTISKSIVSSSGDYVFPIAVSKAAGTCIFTVTGKLPYHVITMAKPQNRNFTLPHELTESFPKKGVIFSKSVMVDIKNSNRSTNRGIPVFPGTEVTFQVDVLDVLETFITSQRIHYWYKQKSEFLKQQMARNDESSPQRRLGLFQWLIDIGKSPQNWDFCDINDKALYINRVASQCPIEKFDINKESGISPSTSKLTMLQMVFQITSGYPILTIVIWAALVLILNFKMFRLSPGWLACNAQQQIPLTQDLALNYDQAGEGKDKIEEFLQAGIDSNAIIHSDPQLLLRRKVHTCQRPMPFVELPHLLMNVPSRQKRLFGSIITSEHSCYLDSGSNPNISNVPNEQQSLQWQEFVFECLYPNSTPWMFPKGTDTVVTSRIM